MKSSVTPPSQPAPNVEVFPSLVSHHTPIRFQHLVSAASLARNNSAAILNSNNGASSSAILGKRKEAPDANNPQGILKQYIQKHVTFTFDCTPFPRLLYTERKPNNTPVTFAEGTNPGKSWEHKYMFTPYNDEDGNPLPADKMKEARSSRDCALKRIQLSRPGGKGC